MNTTPISMSRYTLVACMLLGGLGAAVGHGRWLIPLGMWIAPVLFVRAFRSTHALLATGGFIVVHTAAWEVAYAGMVKMPTLARLGLFAGLSLGIALVLLADRFVARRTHAFWSTLVLPSGWVLFEYLNARFSPSGSWASMAYSFVDQLSFAQVASITGWTGITFLVTWSAAALNHAWEQSRAGRPAARGVLIVGGTLAAVVAYGDMRLWLTTPTGTVRTAAIAGPTTFTYTGQFSTDVYAYTRGLDRADTVTAGARAQIDAVKDRYMKLADREFEAGARIVAFAEANAAITRAEEQSWTRAASDIARKHAGYLGLGLFVFRPVEQLAPENKFVLFGPDGEIVWEYHKAKRVPGSTHVVGDGILPSVQTDTARLGCAICFDMDFPLLLQQAGDKSVNMLLAPSYDWTEVRATHARMATMRAIEQGFAMVRPTRDGISLVTDARGRTIARQDTDRPGDHVLVADTPIERAGTVYARIKDLFSWACMAFVPIGLVIATRRRSPRSDVVIGSKRDAS